jgi:hypothetical protein
MDRMDCQLLMLCFSSFHYRVFIYRKVPATYLAPLPPLRRPA